MTTRIGRYTESPHLNFIDEAVEFNELEWEFICSQLLKWSLDLPAQLLISHSGISVTVNEPNTITFKNNNVDITLNRSQFLELIKVVPLDRDYRRGLLVSGANYN